MVVTIDGTDWLYGERAIRRHVVNLVRLVGTFGEDVEYRIFVNRFRRPPYGEVPEERERVSVKTLFCPLRIWRHLNARVGLFSLERVTGPTDLYHAAGSNIFHCRARHYLYTVAGVATFVRPDLVPPDYARQAQASFRAAMPRVTHYLAVSETTRQELMTLFDIPPERVTAIPLGVDEEFRPLDPGACEAALRERFPIRRPYVLYVGGIQRNKNVAGLIDAFTRASQGACAEHQLVLTGPRVWKEPGIDKAIARAKLGDRLLLTGPQFGMDLVRLYAAADLFVSPTFYEGWTSPPLEAMACGVPVVASRASSVPETVGDAAVLVDPGDPADIAAGMCQIVEDPHLRASLCEQGRDRAASYTWERSIRATVELYQRLACEAPPNRAVCKD